ncbi:fungal-specific transcription factor domain-containing protein [Mariannaea sp. PMI_226]|nr:fungal-specific transcription factor domain-containing protein [Mariannaea sp. PMI_226]
MASKDGSIMRNQDQWVNIVSSTVQAHPMRKKRAQVVRACDLCRQTRIKCDNHIPCSSCKVRGIQCSNAALKSITLPQAYREIERLKNKVNELESELEQERRNTTIDSRRHPAQPLSSPISHHLHQRQQQYLHLPSPSQSVDCNSWNPPPSQEGIRVRAGQSMNRTWYGPSSLFYFIGRISNFLDSAFVKTDPADKIVSSNLASTLLDEPVATTTTLGDKRQPPDYLHQNVVPAALSSEFLSLPQEEYFLELYWNSYHTSVLPVLNEAEFRDHYRSLWTTRGNVRKPSPLVDIVVAMSVQLGVSTLPTSRQKSIIAGSDATVAGRQYYLRCQKLLAYELESPTISTLQCQLLCGVYLCCATFQNMSDGVCGTVVRTAHMLGLHLDPPDILSPKERDMMRRLWWAVYAMDTKIGMKYGRPFLINQSKFLPKFPDHSLEAAVNTGSSFAPLGNDVTWLTFHHEQTKLILMARAAHTALFDQDPATVTGPPSSSREVQDISEPHADHVNVYMRETEIWIDNLPEALKSTRVKNGRPLSVDLSALEIDFFAPLWLQRQRILLELMYHNLCTNLYRPFISFNSTTPSTFVHQTAQKCALHAMALTRIMHQVLSSSTILTGWHEAFQWQWNAAMTLVGFVLAYPSGNLAPDVRKAIDLSVAVLDIFGGSFEVGARAAGVVRDLCTKIDSVISQNFDAQAITGEIKEGTVGSSSTPNVERLNENNLILSEFTDTSLAEYDYMNEVMTGSLQNTLNLAFNIDQWAEPQMLWPNMEGFGV